MNQLHLHLLFLFPKDSPIKPLHRLVQKYPIINQRAHNNAGKAYKFHSIDTKF